jgi:hypothetical protein
MAIQYVECSIHAGCVELLADRKSSQEGRNRRGCLVNHNMRNFQQAKTMAGCGKKGK